MKTYAILICLVLLVGCKGIPTQGEKEARRQEGSQAEASLLEKVKQEVDAEWTRVEKKIKEDIDKARKTLKGQAQSFAQVMAAKILGREIS